jgi:predicted transcriptional regulator of viral defense system
MGRDLLNKLAKNKIFSFEDAKKICSINPNVLKVLLSRLEKQERIERIEKGKYMIIPLGSKKGEYTLNEFVIGSLLVAPAIISYWSALNYYGFTEQIPITVFIQTTARKKKQELTVFGVKYKIIRIIEDKVFGTRKIWFEDTPVNITDEEKTIIDCLDKPQHSGGIIEIFKALKYNNFDSKRLALYSKEIGNSGVVRRLGYICDKLRIPITLPEVKVKNYLLLDPSLPRSGYTNAKWRLIINAELGDLE